MRRALIILLLVCPAFAEIPSEGYWELTIPAPDATLSGGFMYEVDLSDAPASFDSAWNTNSDGYGRACAEDGTTELATHWRELDYSGGTGFVRVYYTSDVTTGGTHKIRLFPPKSTRSQYAASDTYGSQNAYDSFSVLRWWSGGGTDPTANGYDATAAGGVSVGGATGPAGGAATSFDGSDDWTANAAVPHIAPITSWEVPGGFTNTGLCYDSKNGTLWIGDYTNSQLVETTLAGAATSNTVSLGFAPQGVAYDSSDDTLWVSDLSGGEITHWSKAGVEATGDAISPGWGPSGLSYEAATDSLWIVRNGSTTLYRYTTAGSSAQSFTGTGLSSPDGIYYDADNDWLYVSDDSTDYIHVLSAANGSAVRKIPSPNSPEEMTLVGDYLYHCADREFHQSIADGNRVFKMPNRGFIGITVHAWIKFGTNSSTDSLIGWSQPVGDYGWLLGWSGANTLRPWIDGTYADKTISYSDWEHIAWTLDWGGTTQTYQDGAAVSTAMTHSKFPFDKNSSTASPFDDAWLTDDFSFAAAAGESSDQRESDIDGCRLGFDYTLRSAAWLEEDYEQVADNSAFWTASTWVDAGVPVFLNHYMRRR